MSRAMRAALSALSAAVVAAALGGISSLAHAEPLVPGEPSRASDRHPTRPAALEVTYVSRDARTRPHPISAEEDAARSSAEVLIQQTLGRVGTMFFWVPNGTARGSRTNSVPSPPPPPTQVAPAPPLPPPPPPLPPPPPPPPRATSVPPPPTDVPEPGTLLTGLLGLSLAGVYAWRRRRSA